MLHWLFLCGDVLHDTVSNGPRRCSVSHRLLTSHNVVQSCGLRMVLVAGCRDSVRRRYMCVFAGLLQCDGFDDVDTSGATLTVPANTLSANQEYLFAVTATSSYDGLSALSESVRVAVVAEEIPQVRALSPSFCSVHLLAIPKNHFFGYHLLLCTQLALRYLHFGRLEVNIFLRRVTDF